MYYRSESYKLQFEDGMGLLVSTSPVSKPMTRKQPGTRRFQDSVYNGDLGMGGSTMGRQILFENAALLRNQEKQAAGSDDKLNMLQNRNSGRLGGTVRQRPGVLGSSTTWGSLPCSLSFK